MISSRALRARYIPFANLRSSSAAFIDYCLPECTPKYNYALVGPGVTQDPNQPVSLREPHGFQVGGVSMPHGKINPPHLHFTCEVFICTRGDWEVHWGFDPEVQVAPLGLRDIVSVPTWIYRGFRNVGVDDGFLFTALGRDHTGGVLWHPDTLAAAQRNGVMLTEDYRMIDTRRGESLGEARQLQPMTADEIAALRRWTPDEMARRIVRFDSLAWSRSGLLDAALPGCGAQLAPVVGLGVTEDRDAQAPVANAHGVSIEWLRIPAGGGVSRHHLAEKQVLIVQQGRITVTVDTSDGAVQQAMQGHTTGWDTFALPADCWRSVHNDGETAALVLLLTAGEHRKRIQWDEAVVAKAATAGWRHDADGFVAPRKVVDRAQH